MVILKTRKTKLKEKIMLELNKNNPNIDSILTSVDEYEVSNLETIKKLQRRKKIETNKIKGGLKQTINAHGPITKELINSATKRIYGAFLEVEKESYFKRIIKWISNVRKN